MTRTRDAQKNAHIPNSLHKRRRRTADARNLGPLWRNMRQMARELQRLAAPSRARARSLVSVLVFAGLFWLLLGGISGAAEIRSVFAASDPVIAAAGDIACDPASASFNNGLGTAANCRQKDTSDLLVNSGLAAVLDLGDNQYYCGGYQAFLQSYDLSWGRIKSITHPSVGNHEYLTSGGTDCNASNEGAAGYFNYFGSAAGTPGQGYYSFDVGTWHIIALNSNCSNAGGCGTSSAQYKWLQQDLAAHTNLCTLAFWHIPYFSSGGLAAANSKSFWQLLYNTNADLILNGHDHIYERFAPQDSTGVADPVRGIREFIVGTGGANHTSISSIAANSEVRNSNTYGVLKLTLHSSGYDWQFVHENGKTFTDSGSGICHGSAATATPTLPATATATTTPVILPTNTPTLTATALPTGTGNPSVTFLPQADTYVNSASPGTTYGTLSTLRADGSPDVHSYVRFSVTGLAGRAISRAQLSFYMNSGSSAGMKAEAVADNSWGETTVNYNNAPILGATLASSAALTAGTRVTLDVTSYITGEGTYSFGVTTPGAMAISFGSREAGANAPQLIVDLGGTATPSPTMPPTNTATATATQTALPSSTPTATDTATATATQISLPTETLTLVPPTPTDTVTNTPTSTPTDTAVAPIDTSTPTATATPTTTDTPTSTPTQIVLPTSTNTPTATPVSDPTATPLPTASPTPATGQLTTFTPEADTYVNSGSLTSNYGSGTTLRADGSPDVHSYVRFSVISLGGRSITRARLLFYMNSSSSAGMKAQAVSDNTWNEKTVTYNTAPALGSVLASSGALTTGTWVTLDVSSYVTSEGTYSFGVTTPGATAISFASREAGANAPQLILDLGP